MKKLTQSEAHEIQNYLVTNKGKFRELFASTERIVNQLPSSEVSDNTEPLRNLRNSLMKFIEECYFELERSRKGDANDC